MNEGKRKSGTHEQDGGAGAVRRIFEEYAPPGRRPARAVAEEILQDHRECPGLC